MRAPLYVAARHGVILGSGHTPAAAAAAAAARVSSADVHLASDDERAIAACTAGRTLPDTERELLEAVRTDIRELLEAVSEMYECGYDEPYTEPHFMEYSTDRLDVTREALDALEATARQIDRELADAPARARQRDLFAEPSPRAGQGELFAGVTA